MASCDLYQLLPDNPEPPESRVCPTPYLQSNAPTLNVQRRHVMYVDIEPVDGASGQGVVDVYKRPFGGNCEVSRSQCDVIAVQITLALLPECYASAYE